MNFLEYLSGHKNFIQREVTTVLIDWKKETDSKVPQLKKLTKLLVNGNTQGKYIRGALVCLGFDLFSSGDKTEVYKVAAAYEILHTSLLIHDDIMDKSMTRRGNPTVYQAAGGEHYGISQAISLGDSGFFLAVKILAQLNVDEKIKKNLLTYFSESILQTINGQMLDVSVSNQMATVSEKEVLKIARYKTAYYSLVSPLIIGAMLGNAKKKSFDKLSKFGENLGIAFQLRDDILGIFGEEKIIGKSVTSDIEEGKNTLLYIIAHKNATSEQHEFLLQSYGNGKITKAQHKMLQSLFVETNALHYTEKKIKYLTEEARNEITSVTKDKKLQQILETFVRFLIERNK